MLRIAGYDGVSFRVIFQRGQCTLLCIEAQMRFALVGIGAMAFKAPVGKDRADVEIVINRIF